MGLFVVFALGCTTGYDLDIGTWMEGHQISETAMINLQFINTHFSLIDTGYMMQRDCDQVVLCNFLNSDFRV